MQALSGTSQRRSAAAKFAQALRAAKARKGVGNRVICEAAGIPRRAAGLDRRDVPGLRARGTPDCPLRAFSPLPIEGTFSAQRRGGDLRRPEGAWGPTNRDRMLEVVRAANERRWAKPGERERQADESRTRAASRTPEERAKHGRLVSEGRRRPKEVA